MRNRYEGTANTVAQRRLRGISAGARAAAVRALERHAGVAFDVERHAGVTWLADTVARVLGQPVPGRIVAGR